MNFNIKNYFNYKLYLQGLKRLRLTGLVSTICICALAVLCIVSEYISIAISYDFRNLPTHLITTSNSYYNLTHFVVYLIVPVMSFIIWNYLNHRNGSDFYHAIASKRKAVFFSFLAAVITWAAIIIGCITLVTSLTYMLTSGLYIINIGNVIIFSFNVFVSSLLVAATFAIGCSLAGTIFSSLTISTCILFVPRFIITLFCIIIASSNSLISVSNVFPFGNHTCNLPVSNILDPVTYIFSYSGYSDTSAAHFAELGFSTIYTLVLAIIYILLGSIAYHRRRSECAGKSTSNKWTQRIITTLAGYSISLIIACITFFAILDADDFFYSIDDIISYTISCIMVFFFAVVTMFICNIITTKSLKSSLKTLLVSPVIIVLDIITVGLLLLTHFSTLSYTPSPHSVDYVKIYIDDEYDFNLDTYNGTVRQIYDQSGLDDKYYSYNLYYTTEDYLLSKMSECKIKDPEVIAILCDELKESVQAEMEQYSLYGGQDNYNYYFDYPASTSICVTFGSGLFETEREITISYDDYDKILNALLDSYDYKSVLASLPDIDSNSYVSCPGVTDKQIKEIYDVYREELKNVDPSDFLKYRMNSYSANTILMYKFYAGHPTKLELPLTAATPNALGLYMKYINENNADHFYELFDMVLDTSDKVYASSISVNLYDFTPATPYKNTGTAAQCSSYDASEMNINMINGLGAFINSFKTTMNNEDLMNFDQDRYMLCYISLNTYKNVEDEAKTTYDYETNGYRTESFVTRYDSASMYLLIDKDMADMETITKYFSYFEDCNFYVAE